jgi:Cu+-exporting ATPase
MNDMTVTTKLERQAGTQAAEAVCTLSIRGMTCASCVSHVEKALQRTPGVNTTSVNLLGESARVTYRPDIATVEALQEAVRSAGYEAAASQAVSAAEQEAAHESRDASSGER